MIRDFQWNDFGPWSSFLSSFTWALGATVYSKLSEKYSSPAVNFARALVAFPLFILTLFIFNNFDPSIFTAFFSLEFRRWGWFLLSILGSFVIGDTLFFLSTHCIGVPAALAIASTYPIWAAISGWIFLGNPFHAKVGFGVFLTVVGTILVILAKRRPGNSSLTKQPHNIWLGVIFAFATSLFWALNSFALSIAGAGVSPVFSNVIRAGMSLILCPIVGFIMYRKSFSFLPISQLKKSSWIFVIEAFGGSLLFLYGINHSNLATASALSSLAPVIALCLAWALGREKVSFYNTVALGFVALGIWMLVALS